MPNDYIPIAVRQAVITRADERCEYCQSRADYATETFAVDHVIPLSRGGGSDLNNLALACSGCNGRKYNRLEAVDPISGDNVPLFHPRQQRWDEHFVWSRDFIQIIGLTDIGRATLFVLDMNRQSLMNIRKAMIVMGVHPPLWK